MNSEDTDKFTLFVYNVIFLFYYKYIRIQSKHKQTNCKRNRRKSYGLHVYWDTLYFTCSVFSTSALYKQCPKCQNVRKFLFKRQWFLYFILFFSWDITYMKVRKLINPKCISWLKNTKNPIFFLNYSSFSGFQFSHTLYFRDPKPNFLKKCLSQRISIRELNMYPFKGTVHSFGKGGQSKNQKQFWACSVLGRRNLHICDF